MPIEEIRAIGAALIPLSVILFACEMGSVYELFNKNLMSERDMSLRTAYYVFKLPASVLLPALLLYRGAAALAGLSLYSIWTIVHEQHELKKYYDDKKGTEKHVP